MLPSATALNNQIATSLANPAKNGAAFSSSDFSNLLDQASGHTAASKASLTGPLEGLSQAGLATAAPNSASPAPKAGTPTDVPPTAAKLTDASPFIALVTPLHAKAETSATTDAGKRGEAKATADAKTPPATASKSKVSDAKIGAEAPTKKTGTAEAAKATDGATLGKDKVIAAVSPVQASVLQSVAAGVHAATAKAPGTAKSDSVGASDRVSSSTADDAAGLGTAKAKTTLTRSAVTAKKDAQPSKNAGKDTAEKNVKLDSQPQPKTAEPGDHRATPTKATSTELANTSGPTADAAARPTSNTVNEAAPPTGTQVSETRIPVSNATPALASAVAPTLALRVHTVDGTTRAIEIRLDPAELGAVNVKLEKGSDGKLKAVVSADRSESFELLKREGSALHIALQNAGVNMADDSISFQLNDQGNGSGEAFQREAAYGGASARRDEAAAGIINTNSVMTASGWHNGIVDISV